MPPLPNPRTEQQRALNAFGENDVRPPGAAIDPRSATELRPALAQRWFRRTTYQTLHTVKPSRAKSVACLEAKPFPFHKDTITVVSVFK